LHSTLTLLGYADLCPSLQQLHKQLDKLGRFAALMACTGLPYILADQTSIPDLEKISKERQSVHFSESYKDAIKKLLPIVWTKGLAGFRNSLTSGLNLIYCCTVAICIRYWTGQFSNWQLPHIGEVQKFLARITSPCILFGGEKISFDASFVIMYK